MMEQQPQSELTPEQISCIRLYLTFSDSSEQSDNYIQQCLPELAEPNEGTTTSLVVGRFNFVKQIYGNNEKTPIPNRTNPEDIKEIKNEYYGLLIGIRRSRYTGAGVGLPSGPNGERDYGPCNSFI
jgi:hypothetical protein